MKSMWAVALLFVVALAGCSSDDGKKADPAADCDGVFADGVCSPHTEPFIVIVDLPETVAQYASVEFSWLLDNGTRQGVHSMDSRILMSGENSEVTNATGPDDWGTQVARAEHKNLPENLTGTFSSEEQGMFYLKGYMQIGGENVWQSLGTVTVGGPTQTGETTTVTINQGPPPGLSSNSINIKAGEGVVWKNDNAVYGYTISFTCDDGDNPATVTAAAGTTSSAAVFLTVTSCAYTAAADLAGAPATQLDLSGTVNINKP